MRNVSRLSAFMRIALCLLALVLPATSKALTCLEGEIAAEITLTVPTLKIDDKSAFDDPYLFTELAVTNPQDYNGLALASIRPDAIERGEALPNHAIHKGQIHASICVNEDAETLFAWGLYGLNGTTPTMDDLRFFDQYAGIMVQVPDGTGRILLQPYALDCDRPDGLFDVIEQRYPELSRDDVDVQAVCVAAGREMMRDQVLQTPRLLVPDRGYVEEYNMIWVLDYSKEVFVDRLVKSIVTEDGVILGPDTPRPFVNRAFRLTPADTEISLCLGEDGANCFTYGVASIGGSMQVDVPSECTEGDDFTITVGFFEPTQAVAWRYPFLVLVNGTEVDSGEGDSEVTLPCPAGPNLAVEVEGAMQRTQGFGQRSVDVRTFGGSETVVTVAAP